MTNTKNNQFKSLVISIIWGTLGYFMLTLSTLHAQASWTLRQVLDKAEEQSIFRYQANADNDIAQSRWRFFKTNLNPGVSLDILAPNFVKTSREIIQPDGSISFQSVSQNNSSINLGVEQQIKATGGTVFVSTQLQRFDDFSTDGNQWNGVPVRVGLAQPIFGFNELKWADKIEPLALQEADRKYIIDMEDIHLRGTIVFFNLLTAQLNQEIAQSNSDVNVKLLDIAKERFDLGKISKNELLQLELEYKSAIKNLSTAKFQVSFAQGALLTFLGGAATTDITLSTPDPKAQDISIIPSTALSTARANRPDIISFERQKLEADREVNQAQVDFGISANLFASFGYARGSQNLGDIYSDPITEQQVQLSVSIPLLDWGRKKSAVGIAKAQKELIVQQIAQSQLDFDNEIIQAIANWDQLQQQIKLQQEIKDVSLERFEISRQRYVLGDISITDLTIAQREKDQALRDYISTLQDYWITHYQIRRLTAYDFEINQPIQYFN